MRLSTTMRSAAAVAILAVSATACSGGDADASALGLVTDGTLTVCSDIPYAPFEFEDADAASGYSGFDIELVEAMAADLELEVAILVTGFDAIQGGAALAAGTCDVAASAMTITPEREENIDFLDAYFDADQSLLTKNEGPASLDDVTSLGVQADTTGQSYAEDNFDGEITEFPDAAAMFAALEAGNIDAILQDLPVNAERAQNDDSTMIADTFPTGEEYGFAVADGATDLKDALDGALANVRDAGTYDTIYAKYFEA